MPHALAMAVATGKMPLNEALERLARASETERIMKAHDLTRALATQVVLGHADLATYLERRRFQEHRQKHAERSVLAAAVAHGRPMTLAVFGGERVEGKVVANTAYEVEVEQTDGTRRTLHKLELKFAYEVEAYKRIKRALRRDKTLAAAPRRPARRPQDRYTCSDWRLFELMTGPGEVEVTTLEGDVIDGELQWFSRYEFALSAKGEGEIVVFRHALHRIVAAS